MAAYSAVGPTERRGGANAPRVEELRDAGLRDGGSHLVARIPEWNRSNGASLAALRNSPKDTDRSTWLQGSVGYEGGVPRALQAALPMTWTIGWSSTSYPDCPRLPVQSVRESSPGMGASAETTDQEIPVEVDSLLAICEHTEAASEPVTLTRASSDEASWHPPTEGRADGVCAGCENGV